MKKIITLLLVLGGVILCNTGVYAQGEWVEDVYYSEDFSSGSGSWVDGTPVLGNKDGTGATGNTFSGNINTTNKNLEIRTKVANYSFIQAVKTFPEVYSSPNDTITLEFICKIGSAQNYSSAYYYVRDENDKPIFGLGFGRINAGGNKWLAVRVNDYQDWVDGEANSGDFFDVISRTNLMPTHVDGPALKIKAVIDFANQTYDLTATQGTYTPNDENEWVETSPLNQYVGSELPFLDEDAENLANIVFKANGRNNGSATTQTNFIFDNFKIAGSKYTEDKGDVLVKYVDTDNNSLASIKPDVSHKDLSDGTTYYASVEEKANFDDGGSFYYAFDASATTDYIMVESNTTVNLVLKFKKYPYLTNSTLTWTGATNGNWNTIDDNFTSDGENSIGFQPNNNVEFPALASNKTVYLNMTADLDDKDIEISGSGYNISTGLLGNLIGTGALNVNLSDADNLVLNIDNQLSGTTSISGGNITVSKQGSLGETPIITGNATIISGVGQTFPVMTFEESGTIQGGSYVNNFDGFSVEEDAVLTITSTHNTNNDYAIRFTPSGTLKLGSKIVFDGDGTGENKFGMSGATQSYLSNTHVSLKQNAFLYIQANQGGNSTLDIGSLSGDANTYLGWGASSALGRNITWSVGGQATEDTEFAGSISNKGGYAGSGNFYVGDNTHFVKVGSKTLTMSGSAGDHNGNFTVNGGTLNVTGSICKSTSTTTVGASGTLKGTGSVGGATTVNGALEGYLSFGSDLTLAGTTTIVADESNALSVAGDLVRGGTLNVSIDEDPANSTEILLIEVDEENVSGSFATVNLPEAQEGDAYSLLNKEDGIYLKYTKVAVGTDAPQAAKEVLRVEYLDLTGKLVPQNTNGFLIQKIIYVDGSSLTQKIIQLNK